MPAAIFYIILYDIGFLQLRDLLSPFFPSVRAFQFILLSSERTKPVCVALKRERYFATKGSIVSLKIRKTPKNVSHKERYPALLLLFKPVLR